MKRTIPAALIAILATTAFAGEPFSGTHTYRFDQQTWSPMPDAGWRTVTMVGDFAPASGPIIASRIECRGTNFWNGPIREADGVCVLGEGRDTWMLRYRMTRTDVASQTIDPFRRTGEWTVVGGTGRYSGMTGSGTYMAEEGRGGSVSRYSVSVLISGLPAG